MQRKSMSLIAIIDDDPDIIDATSLVLMANGFEVTTANNPGDGYKIIKESKPALIILDVMMQEPDDGFSSPKTPPRWRDHTYPYVHFRF